MVMLWGSRCQPGGGWLRTSVRKGKGPRASTVLLGSVVRPGWEGGAPVGVGSSSLSVSLLTPAVCQAWGTAVNKLTGHSRAGGQGERGCPVGRAGAPLQVHLWPWEAGPDGRAELCLADHLTIQAENAS